MRRHTVLNVMDLRQLNNKVTIRFLRTSVFLRLIKLRKVMKSSLKTLESLWTDYVQMKEIQDYCTFPFGDIKMCGKNKYGGITQTGNAKRWNPQNVAVKKSFCGLNIELPAVAQGVLLGH